ncbi:MAG: hypothetical protein WBM50_06460 [Acidimicrobiales bacterium]
MAPAQMVVDRDLVDLVDALVAAVDTARSWEVERVHAALAPFGAAALFAEELRLNGTASCDECVCSAEGWL